MSSPAGPGTRGSPGWGRPALATWPSRWRPRRCGPCGPRCPRRHAHTWRPARPRSGTDSRRSSWTGPRRSWPGHARPASFPRPSGCSASTPDPASWAGPTFRPGHARPHARAVPRQRAARRPGPAGDPGAGNGRRPPPRRPGYRRRDPARLPLVLVTMTSWGTHASTPAEARQSHARLREIQREAYAAAVAARGPASPQQQAPGAGHRPDILRDWRLASRAGPPDARPAPLRRLDAAVEAVARQPGSGTRLRAALARAQEWGDSKRAAPAARDAAARQLREHLEADLDALAWTPADGRPMQVSAHVPRPRGQRPRRRRGHPGDAEHGGQRQGPAGSPLAAVSRPRGGGRRSASRAGAAARGHGQPPGAARRPGPRAGLARMWQGQIGRAEEDLRVFTGMQSRAPDAWARLRGPQAAALVLAERRGRLCSERTPGIDQPAAKRAMGVVRQLPPCRRRRRRLDRPCSRFRAPQDDHDDQY